MEICRLAAPDAATAAVELAELYTSAPVDAGGLERSLSNSDFVLLIARNDGAAVGYLHGALIDRVDGGRMLMVYDLEVSLNHRRSGVGTALMGEARRIGKNDGAGETWLVTEDDNAEAMALYESLGGTRFPAVGYEWSEQ